MLLRINNKQLVMEFLSRNMPITLNIIGIINNLPEVEVYVDNLQKPNGVLVKRNYFHYIYTEDNNFIDKLDGFFTDGYYGFSGVEAGIADKIKTKLTADWENPCTLYWLKDNKVNIDLIKNTPQNVLIKDVEVIDQLYEYRHKGSLEAIKRNIIERPSSAIYVEDEIVCWCLVHEDNSMGIMYTKEKHRKKGYGIDVALDLTNKIIEAGKIPYLQIVNGNNKSRGLATKCGFEECGKVSWFGIVVGTPT
ncbi:hypothetical protein F8154_12855 [Alkaliphilus pronyensis]|uniref:GCN5-related N-acetyltransferase Rv2170-like domain-containing protein n=1 Tax=Alkaliphilus pronyensis TaxID=1482732 RepID=A0A6I0F845_9FIRM|nr:GNAT family N-acetyltransferase [Alkaliphilus pronyensis]KAB3531307.1 hypothetical protein F8154_12855 [Alkaliphilus pronyensis]